MLPNHKYLYEEMCFIVDSYLNIIKDVYMTYNIWIYDNMKYNIYWNVICIEEALLKLPA